MGLGPSFELPRGTKTAIVFGCALVLATIVAVVRFVPLPLLFSFIAVVVVFASASITDRVFKERSAVVRVVAAMFLQIVAVLAIGLLTKNLLHRWSFVITALTMVIVTHIGTAAVNLYRTRTLSRLSQGTKVRITDYARESFFVSTLESRSLAYYGLLFGFGIGVVLMRSSVFSWRIPSALPVLVALIAAAAVLLFEIGRNGTLMADPLYDGSLEGSAPRFLSDRRKPVLYVVDMPVPGSASDDQVQELACAVADLRKTIFWSSVFGATILFALSLLIAHLIAMNAMPAWLVAPTLATAFLLVQLPYVWGQVQVHSNLLGAREGVARAELQGKLQNLSPLLPRLPALVALTTTGTAGGLLYVAISKMLTDALGLK